jgi:hypothetical protein
MTLSAPFSRKLQHSWSFPIHLRLATIILFFKIPMYWSKWFRVKGRSYRTSHIAVSTIFFYLVWCPAPPAHHILRPTDVFQRIPLQICKPHGFVFTVGPNLCHISLKKSPPPASRRQLSATHWRSELRVNDEAFCLILRGDVGDPTRVQHCWWCHQSFSLYPDWLQVSKVASFRDTTRRLWFLCFASGGPRASFGSISLQYST